MIIVKNIPKLSFNQYNHLHWSKKKAFKDTIRILTMIATKDRYEGGHDINYKFTFKGRKLDTINVVHYCKIIEDKLFKEDTANGKICIEVFKGSENKVEVTLNKIL